MVMGVDMTPFEKGIDFAHNFRNGFTYYDVAQRYDISLRQAIRLCNMAERLMPIYPDMDNRKTVWRKV